MGQPGNPYWRGRLSTVDLLVLSSLPAAFYHANIIYYFTKLASLMRRSIILSFPLQLVLPGLKKVVVTWAKNMRWNPAFAHKHQTRAKLSVSDKHSSLLQCGVVLNDKDFRINYSIFTSMKHPLLHLHIKHLRFHALDTLSAIKLKAPALLF
jgi:hypothetical protein